MYIEVHACACVYDVGRAHALTCRSEDNPVDSVLYFHLSVGPRELHTGYQASPPGVVSWLVMFPHYLLTFCCGDERDPLSVPPLPVLLGEFCP